jgi:FAD dependent oxidoreductase TIGR03364
VNAPRYDLAIVGAGIVGLAHALAAARAGLRVLVVDRDDRANGASVRNFGFITVSGQSAGTVWQRARRSRDIWLDVAAAAHIPIVHRNECLIVHCSEALHVLEQFVATEMGAQCELMSQAELARRVPMARRNGVAGALWSPHELRVEARTAIPALASYLESRLGVTFARATNVWSIATPKIETSGKTFYADRVVVAPGAELVSLFPEAFSSHKVRLCKLHMLRLEPQPRDWHLPAAIMSDFGLIRYPGFSAQPAANALRRLLTENAPEIVAFGIHLIAVQSSNGTLVIGDSHEYGVTLDPFFLSKVEAAILWIAETVLRIPNRRVVERWIGLYPQSESCESLVYAPEPNTRVVAITTGNGMSTAFALAEEVIGELCAAQADRPATMKLAAKI